MTRLTLSIALIALLTLACSASAIPAEIGEQPEPTLQNRIQKPGNAPNPTPGIIYVTAETLNIRTGPGTNYPVIPHVYLIQGEQVRIYECVGSWGRIGAGRWVNSRYLSERCE